MQAQLSIVLNQAYILSVTWCKILKVSKKGECLLQFRTGKHHSDTIPHSVTQADTIRDIRSTQPHECLIYSLKTLQHTLIADQWLMPLCRATLTVNHWNCKEEIYNKLLLKNQQGHRCPLPPVKYLTLGYLCWSAVWRLALGGGVPTPAASQQASSTPALSC